MWEVGWSFGLLVSVGGHLGREMGDKFLFLSSKKARQNNNQKKNEIHTEMRL